MFQASISYNNLNINCNYYPGGMIMPGRFSTSGDYRYGYNGMEMDNETSGNGNSYTTEFRQYDPRLMRWKSLDPLMAQFPWMSPYVAFDNNPIVYTDPYGLESGTDDGTPPGEEGDPDYFNPNEGSEMYDGAGWCKDCSSEFNNKRTTPSNYGGNSALNQTKSPTGDPSKNWGHEGAYRYAFGLRIDLYYDEVSQQKYWISEYLEEGKRKYAYWNGQISKFVAFDANFSCTSCEMNQIVVGTLDAISKYGGPIVKIVGGVVAVAAAIPTGGASLVGWGAVVGTFTVISGTYSAASGIVELTLALEGKDELIKKIPAGYLDATIGAIVRKNVGNTEVVEWIEFSINIIEGGAIKFSGSASNIEKLNQLISSGQQIEYIGSDGNPMLPIIKPSNN